MDAAGRRTTAALSLAAVFASSFAYGDAGTPILWASCFHLAIGNALLGLFEGWLLARLFGARRERAIGWLIAANYFSGWLGVFIIGGMSVLLPPTPHNLGVVVGSTLVASVVATLDTLWLPAHHRFAARGGRRPMGPQHLPAGPAGVQAGTDRAGRLARSGPEHAALIPLVWHAQAALRLSMVLGQGKG